ncbi:glycosyltransferase family 2 protein [Parasporobacterium paucivorans]|uniref:Glycosyltransferase involved in cell wall bisynthesis n=1 Tax=Parasporobacterium paucivorans DSM 15970 TaxID=1122934 RepID=A0A1M6AIF0_9FIRM|nr:glycosyltransferase family 2 protein [Parasporobacterium paucivorans]SHI36098.1 Glycosyltransferase involved in cell wall bisynthesis [Parasporobacterium paucivorans DSM 15970]
MQSVDIVVPCFNEASGIESFYAETRKVLDTIDGCIFHFIFINDGSSDKTPDILARFAKINSDSDYISLSRNFGKEAAIYAGLKFSTGDCVIVMDADLQHPPDLIPEMIAGIREGYDSCAAKRISRTGETFFRSGLSRAFYRISNKMTDVSLAEGVVDYRIMKRSVVDAVLSLGEVQRFSKGLFAWVGFDTKWIPYDNITRETGKSKWNYRNLFKYAMDGITSFSVLPLRLVTAMGFFISVIAFVYIIITLIKTLITGIDVPGYVTTLSAVLFLGGIVEISIGIIGEYIGHIYMEAKKRPIFIIKGTSLKKGGSDTNE